MSYPRGSEWAKWDLHVHTPESLINKYGMGGGDPWANFLSDLKEMPPEFRVVGVNDYIFLDGFRRLLDEASQGALPNIELLLPVVELRLNHFGGSGSDLSRINLHVVFSDELDPGVIESQFINGLKCDLSLLPGNLREGQWTGIVTRESLTQLGSAIRETSAVDQGEVSDLHLGFSNFNVSFERVEELLANPLFDNKYLLAVGKVEWEDQRWNEQSIAFKKTLINKPMAVFTAADTPANFRRAREKLEDAGVNSKLLDCSDAHFRSAAVQPNRIGNCLTWVNATPTFEGLLHALHEYDNRVYVGDLPPKLAAIRLHQSDYFRSIKVEPVDSTSPVPKIDVEVPLNPGVIAIVGNKGKGKSALADIVGLLGGSDRSAHFSFLNAERFCSPQRNLAALHVGTLTWMNGHEVSLGLDSGVDEVASRRVRYLPQSYLESVCEQGPGGDDRFTAELGEVIFSHVEGSDRLKSSSLDELLAIRSGPTLRRLEMLRSEQSEFIRNLLSVRGQLASSARRQLVDLEEERLRELETHDAAELAEVPEPSGDDEASAESQERLGVLRGDLARYELKVEETRAEAATVAVRRDRVGSLRRELSNLELAFERARNNISPLAGELGLEVDDLVKLSIDLSAVDAVAQSLDSQQASFERELSEAEEGSAARLSSEAREEIAALESELQTPARLRQAYLSELLAWEAERRVIVGSESQAGSLANLRHRLTQYDRLPEEYDRLWQKLIQQTELIYDQLCELSAIYASLHRPVQDFIDTQAVANERFHLSFDVNLVDKGLSDKFFALVGRQVSGSYSGASDGSSRLQHHIRSTDFDDRSSVMSFVEQVENDLTHDNRTGKGRESVSIESQLRKGATVQQVLELVFGLEYLEPDFWLRSEGLPISKLSPGQRGTLLLLFYLVVDRSTVPIVLDQPEENLDNETVHDLLVPAISEARKRRQVIVVTHNPNLAVVGDADQIVIADANPERFEYVTGAIEDVSTNERIVAILEGTWPAFRNRSTKYQPSRFRGTRSDPET